MQGDVDARDPRISPVLADPARFPDKVFVITAGYDTLAGYAENLVKRLREDSKRVVVHEQMDRCDHGFDKFARRGTRQWELKMRAYEMAVQMLNS